MVELRDTVLQTKKSLLDLFNDAQTDNAFDLYGNRQIDSIGRDLEMLLNTRCQLASPPNELPELAISLCNYGIIDLACVNLVDPQQRLSFTRTIQKTISDFEPRLTQVQVTVSDTAFQKDANVYFRVEAMLPSEGCHANIVFDSRFEPALRNLILRGRYG